MSFVITYFDNYKRGIPAIISECRGDIPKIKGKSGTALKSYCDKMINKIGENSIPLRVETETGTLVGYFVLNQKGCLSPPEKIQQFIRPSFAQNPEINQEINNFTDSGAWKNYYLFKAY